jgi:hypothetical protein
VPKKLKPYKQRLSELTLSKNCGSRDEITNRNVKGYLVNKRSVSFNGNLGSDINDMGRDH